MFSFVSQGFTLASLIALFVFKYIAPVLDMQNFGYEMSFWVYCGALLCALVLVLVPRKRVSEPLLTK